MGVFTDINYKDSHFEKAELTPIRGEPTYSTLEHLLKELKANARNVHSNLGGGAHGHLGLVISPASYAHLSATPFTPPVFPGTEATIPPGSTQHAARTLRIQFDEQLRVYHEVENVDKALKQQIVQAIEPKYLTAVRNRTSDTITIPVYEVMEYLFNTYGEVTPETFQTKEQETKAMTFDPNIDSIDSLYNEIDDLVDLSGHAGIPMTPEQSITIAYVILWRSGVLKDYLKTWNAKAAAEKTWDTFKTHFRDGVKEYKSLKGPTMQQSTMFHAEQQANLLQHFRDDIKAVIADEISKHSANLTTNYSPSHFQPPVPDASSHYLNDSFDYNDNMQQMANAMLEYKQLVPQLISQVQQLQQTVRDLKNSGPPTNITSDTTSTLTSTTSNSASSSRYSFKPPFHMYCHTHGLCAHNGKQCNSPSANHNKDATFFKRMNGSNRNCDKAQKLA